MEDCGFPNLHFFRLLLPGFSKKLAFPDAFVKHIVKERFSNTTATLVSPNGKSWHVDIFKENMQDNMYFGGENWLQFVHTHNLGLGYFLAFCYRGNLRFNFRAYDLSTCEITSYASDDAHKKDIWNAEKKDGVLFDENTNRSIKKKKILKVKIENPKNFDKFTPVMMRKVSEDKDENKRKSEKSIPERLTESPISKRRKNSHYHEVTKRNSRNIRGGQTYYEAILFPTNISHPYMKIPREFSDANGLTELQELTLIDHRGISWHVRLLHRRVRFGNQTNRSYMTTGWQQFADAYKLKLGDKCVFELASEGENGKVRLKVHIRKKAL